jgi:hypothetical protein
MGDPNRVLKSKYFILFPVNEFRREKEEVDPAFKTEEDAAINLGFTVYYYDHGALVDDKELRLVRHTFKKDLCGIVRGFMMTDDQYLILFQELANIHLNLLNTPEMYNLTHYYPNVFPFIEDNASPSIWFPSQGEEDIYNNKDMIDQWIVDNKKFIVKDYVKSSKNKGILLYDNDEADFDDVRNFLMRVFAARGSLFNKGFVFKKYLNPIMEVNYTKEIRIYVLKNEIVSMAGNNGEDITIPPVVTTIMQQIIPLINSNFYTIDMLECDDGWKIIESGDGQVSGLATQDYPENFFYALSSILLEEQQ